MLHVTNGSSGSSALQTAGIPGSFLSWDDVLHEGPVPGNCSLEELSDVRAAFIHSRGWGDADQARSRFGERDQTLARAAPEGEVVLWSTFELYDQLHMLQILDWYATTTHPAPGIIFPDNYLGWMDANQAGSWFATRAPATDAQISLAAEAWRAFRHEDPTLWAALLDMDTSCLPFLKSAVKRMLEEYPYRGLSLTEEHILEVVREDAIQPGPLFRRCRDLEEVAFMGDWSFWVLVDGLVAGGFLATGDQQPFRYDNHVPDQYLELTQSGSALLKGEVDRFRHQPIDRWIGGVHLTNDNLWCWDRTQSRLVREEVSR